MRKKPTRNSWHIRVADALMAREGVLREKWSYDYGVVWRGMASLDALTGDARYFGYIRQGVDAFLRDGGAAIRGYRREAFNLDYINNGKLLLYLHERTGDAQYRRAADLLRSQLADHPRTAEGGFWHKLIYPQQMWLDGLYMAAPFYAQYTRLFGPEEGFADVARQFALAYGHTKDACTGLCRHGWDAVREQPWADPQTGVSRHAWGRAMGWLLAALVDTLEQLPAQGAARVTLTGILRAAAEAVVRAMDPATGVWPQVLDAPDRPGNYVESSCSCLFVYALARGARLGFLPEAYAGIAASAYAGVVEQFVECLHGEAVVMKCCQVAGLGGRQNRDGTFAYYLSEPIICNDLKATGAFIQAACEVEGHMP